MGDNPELQKAELRGKIAGLELTLDLFKKHRPASSTEYDRLPSEHTFVGSFEQEIQNHLAELRFLYSIYLLSSRSATSRR